MPGKEAKNVKAPVAQNVKSLVTKVFLVDDHPFFRHGVAQSLSSEEWLTICGEASTAEEALSGIERSQPDVLITDLTLPGKSGLELIKDLATLYPKLPVIVLSMHDEQIYAERCLRAGAKGYLMKQVDPQNLLAALRNIVSGSIYLSRSVFEEVLTSMSRQRLKNCNVGQLTDREFEIFELLGEGRHVSEIARQLHISRKTVDAHRANICGKLRLPRASDLLRFAVRWIESERNSSGARWSR